MVFSKPNFKLRLESHVLKDDVTDKEFDFSLMNLTSIRSADTEPTPGFNPPSHLRCRLDLTYTDYRVHISQDPETGDYVSPPKRKKTDDPRNSHQLTLTHWSYPLVARLAMPVGSICIRKFAFQVLRFELAREHLHFSRF